MEEGLAVVSLARAVLVARCCERRMKARACMVDRGPPKSPLFMKGKGARGRLPREHAIAALRCVFLGVQAACLYAIRWCRQRIAQCRHRWASLGGLLHLVLALDRCSVVLQFWPSALSPFCRHGSDGTHMRPGLDRPVTGNGM